MNRNPFAPLIPFDHPANLANPDGSLKGARPMTTFVLGIDIGVTGGIALLNEHGALIDVFDMPCLHDGPKNRRTINAPLLAEIAYKSHARTAFIERVGPRPGEGSVGAFAFGDCKGVIRGVLAAAAIPNVWITSPQWKRVVGVAPGKEGAKDAARAEAIRRWPAQAGRFALKNTDGLAEAALIGLAGLLAFDLRVVSNGPRDNSAETSATA
jgi:crossover junction endodeoxyribonuclease RuvC